MLTTFQHLLPEQITRLVELVKKIVHAVNPDKIICYGSRTATVRDWSIFVARDGIKEKIHSTFDFLIITNDDEKRADHEIIQPIEQQAELLACAVTVIVQKLSLLNELLDKGSRFVTSIYNNGVLVYNGSGLPLATPAADLDTAALKNEIETNWNKCFGQAQRFFKTAAFCYKNGWHEQAAFDLHQAVQHTCMALLRVFTGYRSTTHNLSRLLELVRNFTCDFIEVFPCITKEEADLFNLLNKAYSEARYNEQYAMPAEKSAVLMERVKKLMTIAGKLYDKKLHELGNHQPVSFPLMLRTEQPENQNS